MCKMYVFLLLPYQVLFGRRFYRKIYKNHLKFYICLLILYVDKIGYNRTGSTVWFEKSDMFFAKLLDNHNFCKNSFRGRDKENPEFFNLKVSNFLFIAIRVSETFIFSSQKCFYTEFKMIFHLFMTI